MNNGSSSKENLLLRGEGAKFSMLIFTPGDNAECRPFPPNELGTSINSPDSGSGWTNVTLGESSTTGSVGWPTCVDVDKFRPTS